MVSIIDFPDFLRYVRSKSKLTQHQFARRVNLSRTTIMYLETNRSVPYKKTLGKLAAGFPKLQGVLSIYERNIYHEEKRPSSY